MAIYVRSVSTPLTFWTTEKTFVEANSLDEALKKFEDLEAYNTVETGEGADALDPMEDYFPLEDGEVNDDIRDFIKQNEKGDNQ